MTFSETPLKISLKSLLPLSNPFLFSHSHAVLHFYVRVTSYSFLNILSLLLCDYLLCRTLDRLVDSFTLHLVITVPLSIQPSY